MFDIGWPELFIIAVVVLLVVGPKDLPKVLRTVGHLAGKAKAITREFDLYFVVCFKRVGESKSDGKR